MHIKKITFKNNYYANQNKEYQKRVLTSDPKDTGLQVGDTVDWVSDNGLRWRNKVMV